MKIQGSKKIVSKIVDTQREVFITLNSLGELRCMDARELVCVQFDAELTAKIYQLIHDNKQDIKKELHSFSQPFGE